MLVFAVPETAIRTAHLVLLPHPEAARFPPVKSELPRRRHTFSYLGCHLNYAVLALLLKRFCATQQLNPLSNINRACCHGKILRNAAGLYFALLLLGAAGFAQTSPPALPSTSAPENAPTAERPNFNVKIPRPQAPPPGEEIIDALNQESDNGVHYLHGNVSIELFNATFKADEATYDENTRIFSASGHVYYRNYDRNEVIYCDRVIYNTDTLHGIFFHVRGYAKTKVQARPGVLTTQEPFYFEGAYAEKFDTKYLLYDGMITDCQIPNPWWTMRSHLMDIIPDDRAITHNGIFRVHQLPLFYFPYFYKALKKEPRKSGFLTPNIGHSSEFGYLYGLGYYWAINRSYDMEYLFTDYTARGYAHHVEFRGKPTERSDFYLITYGVQDHGQTIDGTVYKAPGFSATGNARTVLGDDWLVRGNIDYLSSLLFRQTFSYSFNEAIYSSTNSSVFVSKNFDYYAFNTDVTRNENFQSATPGDSIIIRKLPEFDFNGRDRQISSGAHPIWFSFDANAGMYHRVEPSLTAEPGSDYYQTSQFTPRSDIQPSVTTAFHWGNFDVVPSFTMYETFYGQTLVNGAVSTRTLNRTAPEMNIDFALPPIERIFNKKTFLGDKLKHVIEPRLDYRYVTGINDYLDTIRFDQIDLLTDTNQLEFGLTNRLYAKKGTTVNEVLTWELRAQRYFDPSFGGALIPGQRNVVFSSADLTGYSFLDGPRTWSPLVSSIRFSPRPGFGIQWQADYDPVLHRLANSMFAVNVHVKRYSILAGNNQVKPDPVVAPAANQILASFGYGDPNRKGWNTAFSTVYDFRQGIQQFAIAQVTYNTNCCGISFEYRRFNFGTRDDTQYRIAFSIANIGTFGNLKRQERLF